MKQCLECFIGSYNSIDRKCNNCGIQYDENGFILGEPKQENCNMKCSNCEKVFVSSLETESFNCLCCGEIIYPKINQISKKY